MITQGKIKALNVDPQFGIIESDDGTFVFFEENRLVGLAWGDLEVGLEVKSQSAKFTNSSFRGASKVEVVTSEENAHAEEQTQAVLAFSQSKCTGEITTKKNKSGTVKGDESTTEYIFVRKSLKSPSKWDNLKKGNRVIFEKGPNLAGEPCVKRGTLESN